MSVPLNSIADETVTSPTRLHALDAIRAAALLLGIWLHAALSYLPSVRPELWPFLDEQKSRALSVTAYVIHAFRMPVFFLVAGLLARMLLHRLGTRAFVRDRVKRIAVPLVVGWIVCFAAIVAIVVAWLIHGNGGTMPTKVPDTLVAQGPNFMHLWFLWVLLWLYALTLAARAALQAFDRGGRTLQVASRVVAALLRFPLGALVLALPIAGALLLHPDWLPAEGVPTPGYTLVPPPAPLFVYGSFFALGWLMDRHRGWLATASARGMVNLLLGASGLVVCLGLLAHTDAHAPRIGADDLPLYAFAYAVAWPWAVEFAVIVVVTCVVLLGSYHAFVRSTWIGAALAGRRKPRQP